MSKKFDLKKYKDSIKQADTPLKKDKYVILNDALQSVIGLPGIPLGHTTQVFGPSDSGKTSLAFHTAAKALEQGVLPIWIVTETKVSWDRAKLMGMDKDECIIDYVEYIEDIFKRIDRYLADQASGDLPVDILIIVDSIGNTVSVDSVTHNKDGTSEMSGAMMKAAKVIRERMRVISHKINNTRKISSPHYAGLMFINHSYTKPPMFPGAPSTVVPYGGDGVWYSSSLVLKTTKGKKIEATVNKQKVKFGLQTKITVDKNHLSEVSNSGEFVIVARDLIPNEKGAINEYKERYSDEWGSAEIEESDE
jgi:RecA/RadA recombinase